MYQLMLEPHTPLDTTIYTYFLAIAIQESILYTLSIHNLT